MDLQEKLDAKWKRRRRLAVKCNKKFTEFGLSNFKKTEEEDRDYEGFMNEKKIYKKN